MAGLRIFVDFAPSPEAMELLRDGTRGHELVFAANPASSVLARPDPDPQFRTVDVAFGQPDPRAVAEASQLRWIQVSSSGITQYDTPQFRALVAERGIAVCNSASVYSEACALHALSFILAQARSLPLALRTRTANGTDEWNALRTACAPLEGQSVLIIGYGAIGRRLAELLEPFHMKVAAFRRQPHGDEGIRLIAPADLDRVLANEADHVVNILPDSQETRHFFDASRFSAMKPGALLYNIGRGTTVDQDALLAALRSKRLKAAWLDVTDPEPLPDTHPLWAEPNCFITPHIAGGHTGEATTLVRHFLRNLQRFVPGEPLLDRVM